MLKTNYLIALTAIKSNIFRSFLTTLGIIFGVSAVISMLSINESARMEIIDEIKKLGLNNIIIQSGTSDLFSDNNIDGYNSLVAKENLTNSSGSSSSNANSDKNLSKGLCIEDYNVLKEILNDKDVDLTYEFNSSSRGIINNKFKEFEIISTNEKYSKIFDKKIIKGRFISNEDNRSFSKVCVITASIYRKEFAYVEPIGEMIKLGTSWYKIIGVIEDDNYSDVGFDYNNNKKENIKYTLYTPLFTYYKREVGSNLFNLDKMIIKFEDNNYISYSSKLVDRVLNRLHNGIKDYSIIIPKQLMEQKRKTQQIFNIVMGTIASISLLVGGIGIMNIMLANVMERRKEIGIRRALGATRKSILYQFLLESGLISSIGGILGILFSFVLTYSISKYANWETNITITSIVASFLVSVLVGIVSGIIPARKAAKLKPIEALREQ